MKLRIIISTSTKIQIPLFLATVLTNKLVYFIFAVMHRVKLFVIIIPIFISTASYHFDATQTYVVRDKITF